MSAFKPDDHEFIILEFPDAMTDASPFADVLHEMATEIKEGRDVFSWKLAKNRERITSSALRRLFDSAEAKPGLLGFSVDLKKLLTGK